MEKLTVILLSFMLQAVHISAILKTSLQNSNPREIHEHNHSADKNVGTPKVISAFQTAGATDCTPPWMAQSNPFYAKILSKSAYRCPSIFGDSNKVYCCYNSDGDVECCNFQEYFFFRLFCLIPIILIVLIILSFVCCICCFMCPFCMIYKHRLSRR